MLPDLITQLVMDGIPVSVALSHKDKTKICYRIPGFYKLGEIDLIPSGNGFQVDGRYGDLGYYESFEELVSLNYSCWIDYRNRHSDWNEPDYYWARHMVNQGLVSVKTKECYV